ncbi:MAG: magnesium transporter [Acholeplasmataceae bacterium]
MKMKINFKHSVESIKRALSHLYPYDIAVLFTSLKDEEKRKLISVLSLELLTLVFVELEDDYQIEFYHLLPSTTQKSLLRKLETDELKAFIELFEEPAEQKEIIEKLSKIKARTIQLLLTYDEDEAASIMMTDFFVIPVDLTIKEATNLIITESKDNDYIDTVFVEDEQKKCIGFVDLKDLIIARPNQKLENMMETEFPFVLEHDTIESAIEKVQDYDRNVIPVMTEENQVIGIITADDIFDELIEDYEEDYDSFAQISDHDESMSPLARSRQRLPWLITGIVLNLLTISILSMFSATIAQVTVLILFQPMILGMAGNIGTQALAVTILGIHQQDFKEHNKAKKHILKEMSIGLINSLLLGLIAFVYVQVYLSILGVSSQSPFEVAIAVFAALSIAMFLSSTLGSLVPILFDKIGIDPSAASGPMMATVNDIISLVVYFSIATLMFIQFV